VGLVTISHVAVSISVRIPTIAQTAGALSYETECREKYEVVIECNSVPAEPLCAEAQRCADCRSYDGHSVHPVDLLDARVVFMSLQVGHFLRRKWRRHRSCRDKCDSKSFAGVEPTGGVAESAEAEVQNSTLHDSRSGDGSLWRRSGTAHE
jgi:hypothetical protein